MPADPINHIDLRSLFLSLQNEMIAHLSTTRGNIPHPGTKGDASELRWLEMLQQYLPKRYQVEKAFVVDSKGTISDQIDIVIFDRQYSPFLLNHAGALYVPAESVYALLESKQDLNKNNIEYAGAKASSVRTLQRTSVPIPHAGGIYPAKTHFDVLAGIVTLGSSWTPPLGESLQATVSKLPMGHHLDIGCSIQFGSFEFRYTSSGSPHCEISTPETSLIFFFLRLLARLQQLGTVPMLDVEEYIRSL
jgi:hypothetical protein